MTFPFALPSAVPTAPSIPRRPELPRPDSAFRLGQITHRLLEEAEALDANSPVSVLARWRATALVVIQSLCRPDDPAWQILRPGAPWTMPSAADDDTREEAFAEGWAITCGVLEGLLHTVPLPEQEWDRPEHRFLAEQERSIDRPTEPSLEPASGVHLVLLGSPRVQGARGPAMANRVSRMTEHATWLHLNPGSDRHALDAALWPEHITRADRRNTAMSRLRAWLGADHFPTWTQEDEYLLAPSVTSDWSQFRTLAAAGGSDNLPTGTCRLRAALELVTGPPFGDAVRPGWYAWAVPYIEEMTEAIVNAARDLANRYLSAGDLPGARWAVERCSWALPGGLQQFRSATGSLAAGPSEPEVLRQLADQMRYVPAPRPPVHEQTLLD